MATITTNENRAKKIALAFNVTGFDYSVFTETIMREHRTIQQNIFRAMLKLIEHWAALKLGSFDGRNEATVMACKKMYAALDDRDKSIPFI